MRIFKKTWFMLLMCIVFPPLGIFLIWKNKLFAKKPRIILTVVSVILLALYYIPTGDEALVEEADEPETKVEQQAQENINEDISATEEKIEVDPIVESKGESENVSDNNSNDIEENNEIKKTDEEITTSNLEVMMKKIYPNEQIILGEFAEDDFVVLQMTEAPFFTPDKTALRKIAIGFLKGFNTKYENISKEKYYINIEVPGVDKYGNDTFVQAVTYTISKESIRKLNYKNIQNNYQFDLLDNVCDSVVYIRGIED